MPSVDSIYFAYRARQSEVAMNAAHDPTARLVHAKLMAAYGVLTYHPAEAGTGEQEAPDATTGEIHAPLFNHWPEPVELPVKHIRPSPRAPGVSGWDNEGGAL